MKTPVLKMMMLMLVIVFVTGVAAAAETETVVGKIYGETWDRDENATSVILVDEEGEEFIIAAIGAGKELLAHEDMMVEVEGIIDHKEDGKMVLKVQTYKILDVNE